MGHRKISLFVVLAVSITTCVVLLPAGVPGASALTSSPQIDAGGATGMVGFGSNCGPVGAYDDFAWWDRTGHMERPLEAKGYAGCTINLLSWELYPGSAKPPATDQYDPFTFPAGGGHVQRRSADGPNWQDPGVIPLPFVGDSHGAFRATGTIVASTPIADGRVKSDTFQIPYDPYPGPGLVTTNTGAKVGAFASTVSRGNQWTAGVAWPGQYMVYFEDTQTGVKVQGLIDLRANQIPTLDLDAWCFGLDTCRYDKGSPPPANGGAFHPISPSRILDTRTGVGIANGPVRAGDGRMNEPNPTFRLDNIANHELKVTGQFGIPDTGVSAVLLNVTSTTASDPGFVSLTPKPPRVGDIFNDQGSFGALPDTSNLNVLPGVDIPNTVLARVGAGGKIRIYSFPGETGLVADIAGWIDNSGNSRSGTGFVGITPRRLVDTRIGQGGGSTFVSGDDRVLKVAGVAGVPADATSVVLNLTGANAASIGWAVAYPNGEAFPLASSLNLAPGRTRANLAVVKVGKDGSVRLRVAETSADLIVDVYGYFAPGGGTIVPVDPVRVADTRLEGGKLRPFETRLFPVAGRATIPAAAKAVIVNVTATPTDNGYVTVWPSGGAKPASSNVNFSAGQDVPNLAMVALGEGGGLDVFNELGSTDVMLDVMAYIV